MFKDFQGLIDNNHNIVHLKWRTTSLDLNTFDGEYLSFDLSCYIFLLICVNATSEKVQVS
jgi:hypothetical protein